MMVKASTTSTKEPRNAAVIVEVIVVRVVMVLVRYAGRDRSVIDAGNTVQQSGGTEKTWARKDAGQLPGIAHQPPHV
jgi:hypothetical protein